MNTPIEFLREATKAVPAIKYAMGVGGIIATIAIIYSFKIDPRVAFVGTIVMFVLMGVLVVFARMASLSGTRLASPALVFTWFTLLVFMAVSIALFTSVFFKKPLDLTYWLTGSTPSLPPPTTSLATDQLNAEQRYELIKLAQTGCYFFVPGEAITHSVTDYIKLAQKEFADSLTASEAAIVVQGYLETGYSEAYALRLSEMRAVAVKNILVSRGLDSRRIYTEGHGMNHNQKWVREYFCGARIGIADK